MDAKGASLRNFLLINKNSNIPSHIMMHFLERDLVVLKISALTYSVVVISNVWKQYVYLSYWLVICPIHSSFGIINLNMSLINSYNHGREKRTGVEAPWLTIRRWNNPLIATCLSRALQNFVFAGLFPFSEMVYDQIMSCLYSTGILKSTDVPFILIIYIKKKNIFGVLRG